jgi:hypothetical protein
LPLFTTLDDVAMAPVWTCDCCCERFHDYTSIEIDSNSVCVSCVRKMFDKALKFEHNYPPKWSEPLHPSEFSHIFSADYISNYKNKEIEYNTPPNKRVYCQYDVERAKVHDNVVLDFKIEICGDFIGARQKPIKNGILVFGRCKGLGCQNVTCMVCEYYCNSNAEDMLQHICPGKSRANEKRAQAFSGLKRGKDWQQCPSRQCERRIELSEACNHISCQCGMGFCFICGKEADGESDHWRKGGCPRYHQPGDANVEYDDYGDDEDDGVSASDEHDERDNEADIVENVRDLFGTDEVLPTPPVSDYLERMAAAVSHLRRPPTADQLAGEIPMVDQLADPRSAEVGDEPEMPELIAIAPNDAEAIANAFLEDDISDDGHHASSSRSVAGIPVVTMEEADIDQTLWRMAVE